MKTYVRILLGTAACCVMLVAWQVAIMRTVRRDPQQLPIYRPLPAIIDSEPSNIDLRFVASTLDRKTKRYHLPSCSYVKLMQHGREFKSEEEARAAGYEPCLRCFSTPRLAQSALLKPFPE